MNAPQPTPHQRHPSATDDTIGTVISEQPGEVGTARTIVAAPTMDFDGAKIRELRDSLQLTQAVFAAALNVSPETVRAWEQGKRIPDGPAVRLLDIAVQNPDILLARVQKRRQGIQPPVVLNSPGEWSAESEVVWIARSLSKEGIGSAGIEARLRASVGLLEARRLPVPKSSRVRLALKFLEELNSGTLDIDFHSADVQRKIASVHRLGWEIFVIVYAAYEDRRNLNTPFTRERLEAMLKGPLIDEDEGTNTNARDTQFELYVSAMLRPRR